MSLARSNRLIALGVLLACAAILRAQQYESVEGKWVEVKPPAPGTPAADLQVIRNYVDHNQNGAAVGAARDFAKKYPGEAELEEVYLLAGEAEYRRNHLFQAYQLFEKQLTQFPAGRYAERAMLREYQIGDDFLNGKKRLVLGIFWLPAQPEGLEILHRVVEHTPGSLLGERAMIRIADFQFNQRNWPLAVEAYDQYVQLFRNGARVPYATLQAARASLLAYRGPQYDDTPLLDAEQRFKIFREHYPAEAAKVNVNQTLTDIRDLRARKLYSTVEFYKRTGKPIPEAFYANEVIDEFPQSPQAQKSEKELAALGPLKAPPPAPVPQTQPFKAPPPEPTTTQATSAPGTGPLKSPVFVTSRPSATTQPSSAPVRLEELAPTSRPAGTQPASGPDSSSKPASQPQDPSSAPSNQAASQPATAPNSGGRQ